MVTAIFTFYDGLDFFLPHGLKGRPFSYSFQADQSLKHLIEALGLPHVESGRLLVNGADSELHTLLHEGDRVEVFAASCDSDPDLRFILDVHLGRLAVYLRMIGFDTAYRNDFTDPQLVQLAVEEDRILVTRDRRLLMHTVIRRGYCPRSLLPGEQLREVVQRYNLASRRDRAPRCPECNLALAPVEKSTILDRLEPLTKRYYEEFSLCPGCRRIYWKGSHWNRVEALLLAASAE